VIKLGRGIKSSDPHSSGNLFPKMLIERHAGKAYYFFYKNRLAKQFNLLFQITRYQCSRLKGFSNSEWENFPYSFQGKLET